MKKVVLKPFLIAALFGVVACEDEDLLGLSNGDSELALGEYYMEAESVVSYLYNLADKAYNDSTFQAGDSTQIWGIPIVATPTSAMEIRFGNGITGDDGITRKGLIKVNESGNFSSGGSLSFTFDNFRIDDRQVGSSNTTMNVTNVSAGSYTIGVNDFGINNEFDYSGNKSINWLSGLGTPEDDSDDTYNVGGTFSGMEIESGNGISGTVTEALLYDRSCEHSVVEGLVDLSFTGDSISATGGSIDFQKNDGCSNVVVITITTENGGNLTFPKTFNGF